uniref:Ig-like domain-containing protein n=1 Tax=Monopterus albus TaxID=43700 RepID=A0A3Q3K1E2_MONAL
HHCCQAWHVTDVTRRPSSTLTFNLSAEHHDTDLPCKVSFTGSGTTKQTVTLNVTYVKKPGNTGNITVQEGDALNLTCIVKSVPPFNITWTKPGSNETLQNITSFNLQNGPRGATLFIPNVTAKHSGQYICTAKHLNITQTIHANITVRFPPKILNGSECVRQSEVLTCVCVSEGVPLPTIKYHTEYSVLTTVTNHTVNSRVSFSVTAHSNTTVTCVSNSETGEANGNSDTLLTKVLKIVQEPKVIIAFFTGMLLSAIVCCLATCHRCRRHNVSENLAETLEMVSTQVPLINGGEAAEGDWTYDQEAAAGGAEAAGQSAPDGDVEPKEVEYSNLDFSVLKRKGSTEVIDTQEATESEYAEIKKEATEERQDDGGEDGEILNGNKEAMVVEDKEREQCMPAEEHGGEDAALYSNVNEVMDQY